MNIYKNILCALFLTHNVYTFSASETLNTAFGTSGITLTAIGASAQISGPAIQTSGNIIAAETSDDNAPVSQYIA